MAHHSDHFGKNICWTRDCEDAFVKRQSSQLKNITFKEIFEKFKQFFELLFFIPKFLKFSFRLILMVSTTYIFFIKIGRAFSEKSHFFDFFSPSIIPKKTQSKG